jgi:hypothetical protein
MLISISSDGQRISMPMFVRDEYKRIQVRLLQTLEQELIKLSN